MTLQEEAAILEQLSKLEEAKTEIRKAINESNVQVGVTTPFVNYADAIRNIARGPGLGGIHTAVGLVNAPFALKLPPESNYGGGMSYRNAWQKGQVATLVHTDQDYPDEPTFVVSNNRTFRLWALAGTGKTINASGEVIDGLPTEDFSIVCIEQNTEEDSDGHYDVDAIMNNIPWLGFLNLDLANTSKIFAVNDVIIKWTGVDLQKSTLISEANSYPTHRYLFYKTVQESGVSYLQNINIQLRDKFARVVLGMYLLRGIEITCLNNTVTVSQPFANFGAASRIYFESWLEVPTGNITFQGLTFSIPGVMVRTYSDMKDITLVALAPNGCDYGIQDFGSIVNLERICLLGTYTRAAIELLGFQSSIDKFYIHRCRAYGIGQEFCGIRAFNISNGIINEFLSTIRNDINAAGLSINIPDPNPLTHIHYALYARNTIKQCKIIRSISNKCHLLFANESIEDSAVINYILFTDRIVTSAAQWKGDRPNSVFRSNKIRRNVIFRVSQNGNYHQDSYFSDFSIFSIIGDNGVIEENFIENYNTISTINTVDRAIYVIDGNSTTKFNKNVIGEIISEGRGNGFQQRIFFTKTQIDEFSQNIIGLYHIEVGAALINPLRAKIITDNLFGKIHIDSGGGVINFISDATDVLRNQFGDIYIKSASGVIQFIAPTNKISENQFGGITIDHKTGTINFIVGNNEISKNQFSWAMFTGMPDVPLNRNLIAINSDNGVVNKNTINFVKFFYDTTHYTNGGQESFIIANANNISITENAVNCVEAHFHHYQANAAHFYRIMGINARGRTGCKIINNLINNVTLMNRALNAPYDNWPPGGGYHSCHEVVGIAVNDQTTQVKDNTVSVYGEVQCVAIDYQSVGGSASFGDDEFNSNNVISAQSSRTWANGTAANQHRNGIGIINGRNFKNTKIRRDHLITGHTYVNTKTGAADNTADCANNQAGGFNERIEDWIARATL